jgi:predicted nucleotidyltransferase
MHIAPAQFSRIADICRRYHVRSLQLFGSAAVGAERADSGSTRSTAPNMRSA